VTMDLGQAAEGITMACQPKHRRRRFSEAVTLSKGLTYPPCSRSSPSKEDSQGEVLTQSTRTASQPSQPSHAERLLWPASSSFKCGGLNEIPQHWDKAVLPSAEQFHQPKAPPLASRHVEGCCWAALLRVCLQAPVEMPSGAPETGQAVLDTMPVPQENGDVNEATLLMLLDTGSVWLKVLGLCSGHEAASAAPCCKQTNAGAHDRDGRLLMGAVTLSPDTAPGQLKRISPHLLVKMSLPGLASGAAGEAVLATLAQMRGQLTALKDVSVNIAPPRLPRVTGESREDRTQAVSVLANALSAALPKGLDSFHANLRGGCLLADDAVLTELVNATPKHLTRLGLDLNSFSCKDALAIARVIPASLRELRLLFHGRSFAWLGSGADDAGTEELASALPMGLEKLHLMLESSCQGLQRLCKALPPGLQQLALDLQVTVRSMNPQLAQALATPLSRLSVFQLRLADFNMTKDDLRSLASAFPNSLRDLRLDISCRDVGDDGASLLAANMPKGLERLTLCLRDWRFSAVGLRMLATAIPQSVRQLKLVFSGSCIGAHGARALASHLPTGLARLNISLRHCSIGRDGEQALRPLARRWNALPRSWVRVYEKTASVVGLQRCCEWDLWED